MRLICLFFVAARSAAFQLVPNSRALLAPHRQLLQQRHAIAVPLDRSAGSAVAEKEDVHTKASTINARDAWVENLDYDAFRKDVNALGKELLADTSDKDVEHLNKILTWRNIAAVVGISTMWVVPNPITIVALSTWTYASWTMGTLHTCLHVCCCEHD
jgi:hypothetical protein